MTEYDDILDEEEEEEQNDIAKVVNKKKFSNFELDQLFLQNMSDHSKMENPVPSDNLVFLLDGALVADLTEKYNGAGGTSIWDVEPSSRADQATKRQFVLMQLEGLKKQFLKLAKDIFLQIIQNQK